MKLVQKLKAFEKAIVYMRWATFEDFGRIKYVGEDFVEFETLDPETMQYGETFLINSQLILEVMISGIELSRIVAEMSANLPNAVEIDLEN